MSLIREDFFETIQIVWLAPYVNDTEDNRRIQDELRKIDNGFKSFDRIDMYHEYIQTVSSNDRIIFIVSDQYGQQLLPRTYQLRQISSIYIHCFNRQTSEQWSQQFKSKVRKISDSYTDLLRTIKDDYHRQMKANDLYLFQFFHCTDNPEQSTTILNGHFRHSLLLIEILIHLPFTETDRKEFYRICRTYKKEHDSIRQFEQTYSSDRALWWYTHESFVCRILNQALRAENIEILFLFRFIIKDIFEQLKQHQCRTEITVYRGQFMSDNELTMFRQKENQLISLNSFFSTSLSRDIALDFCKSSDSIDDLHRVLFEIHADPNAKLSRPFANINQMSKYQNENEVLFMIGCVFRKVQIYRKTDEHLWIIELKLCGENDTDSKDLFDYLKKQLNEPIDLRVFGNVLIDMGKYDLAERMFNRMLSNYSRHRSDVFRLYESFARLAQIRGDFDSSLECLNEALKIQQRSHSQHYIDTSRLYHSIANIYTLKGRNHMALEYCIHAVRIFEDAHDDNHLELAYIYKNIATIYQQDEQNSIALDYYKKALDIILKHIPIIHPDIGMLYNSIGSVYVSLKEYEIAEPNYNLSLDICSKSLPADHQTIAIIHQNIGFLKEQSGQWKRAFDSYKQAMDIYYRSLSADHRNILQLEKDCERVLGELCKQGLEESLLLSDYVHC